MFFLCHEKYNVIFPSMICNAPFVYYADMSLIMSLICVYMTALYKMNKMCLKKKKAQLPIGNQVSLNNQGFGEFRVFFPSMFDLSRLARYMSAAGNGGDQTRPIADIA